MIFDVMTQIVVWFSQIITFVFSIDLGGITIGAIFWFFFINTVVFKLFTGVQGNFTFAKRMVRKEAIKK